MFLRKLLLVLAVLVVVSSCSKKEDKSRKGASPVLKTEVVAEVKSGTPSPGSFHAAKYTDSDKWINGVSRRMKSQFFISINKSAPTPFVPGHKLEFAKSGKAVIRQVYRMDNPDNSSVFITVDKDLDPVGDGHPNPIHVRSLQMQASNYSKENSWRNGISLTQPGMFLIMVEKKTQLPFKVGDRLFFAGAGEAVIKGMFRNETLEKFSQVFVTVDRSLDPERDGNPNAIEFTL